MLATKILSAVALVITPVLADGAAIVDSLGTIAASTAELNNTVSGWDGNLMGTLSIVMTSGELLFNTKQATKAAQESANLSAIEALTVATSIHGLTQDMNVTLSTLVAAKPKFDRLFMGPAILISLVMQKHATDDFSAGIVAKVPTNLASAATQIAADVDVQFDTAIDAYDERN